MNNQSSTLRSFTKAALEWEGAGSVPRELLSLALFECAFYFAYRYGMSFSHEYPSPFWFPDSVLLCALLVRPRSEWWMYILGTIPIRFLVAVPEGTPLWFLFSCFLNDSMKGLLSAFLLRRRAGEGRWFHDLTALSRYLLVAVGLSPVISALAGAATRIGLGEKFWPAFGSWYLGNALAALVVTPVLVCLVQGLSVAELKLKRYGETVLMTLVFIFGIHFIFSIEWNKFGQPLALLYLPVPFLIWAAVRLGPMATCLLLSIVSALVTVEASQGTGPFASNASPSSVLPIQLFLIVPAVSFLLLSVLRQQQRSSDSALRESERRFRSLVDTAPIMVWMSDMDGLCTYFNNPWLEFIGTPLERQLGNGWVQFVHPQDRERILSDYRSAFHQRKTYTLEYRLQRHDGDYHWILANAAPRQGTDGQFQGYIGTCIDIEERRKAEDELLRLHLALMNAQEAERQRIGQELHDDLGQRVVALLIGISHLSEKTKGDERLRASFADMRQQASDIVKDIAHLSHHLRPVMLERLGIVGALQDLCSKSKTPAGVKIVFTQDGELPEVVPWTPSIALYRVAQEALRNAVTHSGSNYIHINLSSGSELVMTVIDKGCGFTFVDERTAGLGLSGMAERIRQVNGIFDITSSPGAGTTVTASVPLPSRPPLRGEHRFPDAARWTGRDSSHPNKTSV